MRPETWKEAYHLEIQQAASARLSGNEGRARVCARRAAGILIGEYLQNLGVTKIPESSYDRLRLYHDLPQINEEAREVTGKLLLRVNTDHSLPADIDLIEEVNKLGEILGNS